MQIWFASVVLIVLSGTAWAQDSQVKERDYSTPSGRLIGKWQSEGTFGIGECEYYGPADRESREGVFVRYRRARRDRKSRTDSWQEFRFRYKILDENVAEHRVTVKLIFGEGEARNESYYIEPNGLSLLKRTVIAPILGESVGRLVFLSTSAGPCDSR